MPLRAVFLSLLAVAFATAASASSLKDYKGADAGRLVLGIAAASAPLTNVEIRFRRVSDKTSDGFRVDAPAPFFGAFGGKVMDKPDATADAFDPATTSRVQAGGMQIAGGQNYIDVKVLSLPPGQYEIYTVVLNDCPGMYCLTETFGRVRIPFEIKPGRASYVGRLSVVGIEKPLGLMHRLSFWRWVLNLNDQPDQDLPLAAQHAPDLGPVDTLPLPNGIGQTPDGG